MCSEYEVSIVAEASSHPPRRKLIEVALPLEAINAGCQQEKNPFLKGHPRNMHLWWARRPLAACRAVLFSSLVDDPSSDPDLQGYSDETREDIIATRREDLHALIRELVKWENSNNPEIINAARAEIARSVASRKVELGELKPDMKLPGGETVHSLIVKGKYERKLANISLKRGPNPESVNTFLAEHAPPVLDPFCGGGSIPLEAQRLGLCAHASDLNPVPVLITKALIEIPPKFAGMPPVNHEDRGNASSSGSSGTHATKNRRSSMSRGKIEGASGSQSQMGLGGWKGAAGLAADVRYYGQWMRDEAAKRIGHLYPKINVTEAMARDRKDLKPYVGQELTVIAWLWARTIKCPNPGCVARTPLVRSFWLSTKKGKEVFARPILDRARKSVHFEIALTGEPPKHTTDRAGARCLFCDTFIKKGPLRDLSMEHGLKEVPLAIVAEGTSGRVYLSGNALPPPKVERADSPWVEQPITNDRRWFSPPLYGMPNFADLFTARQLVALTTFSDLVMEAREKVLADAQNADEFPCDHRPLAEEGMGPRAYADAVATYLAFGVGHLTRYLSTLCGWNNTNQNVAQVFGRQALPMVWDFAEANCIDGVLSYPCTLEWSVTAMESLRTSPPGVAAQVDAQSIRMPQAVVCTDPPYYDNIGYSDLADFFYVWLRRSIGEAYPTLFKTLLTPKAEELIATPFRHGGSEEEAMSFFQTGLGRAFDGMRATEHSDYPLTVFYAFKQSESNGGDNEEDSSTAGPTASTGWETMLEGVIKAGFAITGTLPLRTERTKGLKGAVNALASSIVLVCHPRDAAAHLASRKEFIGALKRELPEALRDLQSGNIAPVDLAQAAIGPGMAVFTRYSKVMENDGSRMGVRTALGLINQVLDETLSEQEGEYDADTRWAIKWFEQYAHNEGPYGDAETLCKAMAVGVNGLVEGGIVAARSGKVRLLKRSEMPADWDPATDNDISHWEVCQQLIRRLQEDGEEAAAELLRKVGGIGEIARDLAYRLYTVCERKKWAQEAIAYNALVVAWPEIRKLAATASNSTAAAAAGLFGAEG